MAASTSQRVNRLVGQLRTRFALDLGTTLLATTFVLIATTLQSVVIARAFGPAGKGLVGLTLLVPGTLAVLTDSGFASSTVYFSSRAPVATLQKHALTFAALAAGLVTLGIAIAHWSGLLGEMFPDLRGGFVLVVCAMLPVVILHDMQGGLLQGLGLMTKMNGLRIALATLTLLAVLGTTAILRTGPLGVAAGILLASALVTALESRALLRLGGRLTLGWDRKVIGPQFRFAALDHVGGVLQFLNYRLDQYMVAGFLGVRDLGLYSVAVTMAELLWLVPNTLAVLLFPRVSRQLGPRDRVETLRLCAGTLLISTITAGALAAVGGPVIRLLFSARFDESFDALLWLLPGACLLGPAKVLVSDLAGRGRPGVYSVVAAIGLVLTVSLDVLLIPDYGIRGAAIASSVAYAAVSAASFAIFLFFTRSNDAATLVFQRERFSD